MLRGAPVLAGPPEPVARSEQAAPSEEECAAFGEEIARAVNGGTASAVVDLLDPYALAARTLAGIEMKDDFRRGVAGGIASSARESMLRTFGGFGKARFLRVLKVDGELRPLVRLMTQDGGMNYHAYVVARRASGRLKWVDTHVCLTGELMSETMRRLLLPAVAEENAGFLERLTRGEGEYMKNLPKITAVQQKLQTGDIAGAQALLDTLPQELRAMKPILAMRLLVAQKGDQAAYLEVIREWESHFPSDPSLGLVGIDGAFLRQDYDGGLKSLGRLRAYTGDDPHLDLLEATMLRLARRFPEARAAARLTHPGLVGVPRARNGEAGHSLTLPAGVVLIFDPQRQRRAGGFAFHDAAQDARAVAFQFHARAGTVALLAAEQVGGQQLLVQGQPGGQPF